MNARTQSATLSTRDIPDLSLMEVSALVASRQATPLDVTQAVLARVSEVDGALTAYITLTAERALEQAEIATRERAAGLDRGPLHGIPVAFKDLCETDFAPTSAGLALLRDNATGRNATVTARLEQAGCITIGKLGMTEGAYSGHNDQMPVPKNPWNPACWAGSSSSGSGVSVAAGMAFGATGSDTGGSIRFPSGCNGITGMKGTWGRVSRHGVFALADSLDHVGPMARAATDCAAIMTAIAGPDVNDPTALMAPVPDYLAACSGPIRGMRIGLDRAAVIDAAAPETAAVITEAVAVYESLGAEIVPMSFPFPADAVDQWTVLCAVEVALAHQGRFPEQRDGYGPHLTELLDYGLGLTAREVGAAMQWRLVYNGSVARAMHGLDAVLLPITGGPMPELDNIYGAPSAGKNENLGDMLKFTAPADFTGCPSLTLPGGFDSRGAPIGFQLMGPALTEDKLFKLGAGFQRVTDFHTRRPDLTPFR
ncbi:amidase [Salipiger aestuarii]|uniref:Amidase n=1 Tax=Salipiger aestuarii TaxID=568098 RepID=A0A327YFU8_9RHOB|nr:amidase [Salipiger aestuarii]EIE51451.1 amidase [Citreicella sp. 357]KAA8608927.1 amidase [Salipiger aestuarii]KAA8613129.1 amidase [Salipiger aestuarii]KAB2543016.1 amidase [Salipiger aestuarii]RAK19723.1 amidase [Salipiger aestuarii]